MLKVTLLKVRHDGEQDAKKLLDHIKRCDVYAPERLAGRVEQAVPTERMWMEDLKLSRSAFLRKLESLKDGRKSDNEFETKQLDYMFRQAKPMVILEKFSGEESEYLLRTFEESDQRWRTAHVLMFAGSLDQSMETAAKAAAKGTIVVRTRDKHIAENVDHVEGHIRQLAPHLADKAAINLTICLGAKHSPEQYSSIPMDIQLLENDPFGFPLHENAKDYPKRDLFAYVLSGLLEMVHIRPDPAQFRAATVQELDGILKSNRERIRQGVERMGLADFMR
jgi:hypothetical protein